MKKKVIVLLAALFVLGLTVGAYAVISSQNTPAAKASCSDCCKGKTGQTVATDAKDSCCDMDCCKDGHCQMGDDCCCKGGDNCPMKNKQAADKPADMSKVVFVGGEDSCCSAGSDCCNGGSCCHKKG